MEDKDNGDQVRRLPDDLLNHVNSEEWVCFLVGLAVKQGFQGVIRREHESARGVMVMRWEAKHVRAQH
jgi:hypothetical protein